MCVRKCEYAREKGRDDDEWYDYKGKSVRDEACKVPRDVIRPLDLGASRYIVVSEEANSAAWINLSLMHCERYSTRRTAAVYRKDVPEYVAYSVAYTNFLINLESILIILLIKKYVVCDQERVRGFWYTLLYVLFH